MPQYGFHIDIFSHCNLRCPTCIVGNKYGSIQSWPKGYMQPEFLRRLLDKAQSECTVQWVGLFNWTEPTLHPRLSEMVREVKSRGIYCKLSSNLNVLREPEKFLAAGLDQLRISLSGFTQPIYEIGHHGGEVETVKRNMIRLSEAKAATGAKTRIDVFYHRYVHNAAEVEQMRKFSESLGFGFGTILAQMFPVEKIIDIAQGKVTAQDERTLSHLALPLEEALRLTAPDQADQCGLLDEQVALDVHGNAVLCCGCSMERQNVVGNFLEHSLEELQARRRRADLCGPCLRLGIPDYFKGDHPQFETIAQGRIDANMNMKVMA